MDAFEQARFDDLYARHLRALKLQGKAPATVDGYARALRRAAAHFDRCPDQLSVEDQDTHRSVGKFLHNDAEISDRQPPSPLAIMCAMTQARAHAVAEGQHGLYHCVTRCVRRAWLCGVDPLTRVDHEQRKKMVEARIRGLGSIFAVGIYAYAVMSNHLHVVVSVEPAAATDWTGEEVAERWLRLYPIRDEERYEARKATLMASIDTYRKRLCDLSWFMKSLDEFIARRANAEEKVTGRFWEG